MLRMEGGIHAGIDKDSVPASSHHQYIKNGQAESNKSVENAECIDRLIQ
jgi:hypothetical protein